MKKLCITFVLTLLSITIHAQNISSKDAQQIKSKKLIVALAEYKKRSSAEEKQTIDAINTILKETLRKEWTFNEIVDYMPLSEAMEYIKKNKKTHCYIYLGEGVTTITHDANFRYITSGNLLGMFAPKRLIYTALPAFEGGMDHPSIVFAVLQLQYYLNLLADEKIDDLMGSRKYIKKNGTKVTKKTLLIPEEYISPKISKEEIKQIYPYDLEISNIEKIKKAILDKDPKYAVVFYVPVPAGKKWVHVLYVSSAADGEIFGYSTRGNVQINMGIFGAIGGGKREFVIHKKEMEDIGDMVK